MDTKTEKPVFEFNIRELIHETDKLKSVYRTQYLTDQSRHENSAEHSWHVGIFLLALKDDMPETLNFAHALELAIAHDMCEIGAGDVSVYSPDRSDAHAKEQQYLAGFRHRFGAFGDRIERLWTEYEEQKTLESQWVKLADRLIPFTVNILNEGRSWKSHHIKKSQVFKLNAFIAQLFPALYACMQVEVDHAVANGWLIAD